MRHGGRVGRRAFVGGVATALAGCIGAGGTDDDPTTGQPPESGPDPVSLTIKTTPSDDDPYAMRIARTLSENLNAVGVRTDIVPMAIKELLESVLVDQAFDLYVARHPGGQDPDYLRSLLHADNGDEAGWRNPFGYVDSSVTDLLERQRLQRGDERTATVHDLLTTVRDHVPMMVLAHPDSVHAIRNDRIVEWPSRGLQTADDLLELRPAAEADVETVRIAIIDDRPTRNQNPLAFSFRDRGLITELLYEPLVRERSSGVELRLASGFGWTETEVGDRLSITLEDAVWHDGTPVTAADVAFTYRFVADTAMGSMEDPVPAPMFRGRSELVDTVSALDDRTVSIDFDASREVAFRALTLPILPKHVWEPKANPAAVAGIQVFGASTEALRWANPNPVGSGPFAFEAAENEQRLELTRFDDHFTEGPAFEGLTFRVAPSDAAAIELVLADEVDATGPIDASLVSNIARSGEATMIAGPARSFYHVGFNVREPPLDAPRFRRGVGTLLDRRDVVSRIFDGFASPAIVPVDGQWKPDGVEDEAASPTETFPGQPGELDREAAVAAFRDAGYRVHDGAMIADG
ncbi:ABC-type transport system, periplasmic component [Halanaeroarchaeum sp. HSR-CO]|uniref:ABC transporter substrate-binding protein n=1 Tax=Halanaeroarchaeum sp. HSR-CO TaxID=2866382 RepID=UPI00217D3D01|nr:ABC transporter substrate-binding protein [Halanaeroarchaeum sp. HSR-CO]UWG46604.1 ABC-type transport system, periplasmic component [Halanaeroarchaeum sp. HSR-CO]